MAGDASRAQWSHGREKGSAREVRTRERSEPRHLLNSAHLVNFDSGLRSSSLDTLCAFEAAYEPTV